MQSRVPSKITRSVSMAVSTTLALAIGVSSTSAAFAGELNILTWEGYADPSFIKDFETKSSCKVSATYVGSNDDFAPKLAAGSGVYDIIVPSIDTIGQMRLAGFVDSIDLKKVPEFGQVHAKFRSNPDVTVNGEVWAVPLIWGSVSVLYRTDKVTQPNSIKVLWNPEYKGRISLWDDKSAIYWAARMLGYDNIYDLDDTQLATIKARLIEQKPLVRKYWSTAGELAQLFLNDEVWVSNAWTGLIAKEIRKGGKPFTVAEVDPAEKSEGWMDSMMLVKGSPNTDCSYQFINYMLSAKGQCGIVGSTDYFPTNPVSAKTCLPAEEARSRHLDDPGYVDSLVMWQMPKRLDAYLETWNAVKAAM
ncbi:putative spermidine/putrescine transport system substrate-binding protein/spermidine/putrescine transport system substrate-binding protein [Insolitispirillum peregrinum]|uniref:Putative spermidine/putrescine transport system substrate-binding protein/spermidine/putrescine transport system substrate-binding protein n=2 Tax=Insolitispirillum peregrinum TaxID=80876 RepID=A0A1N7JC55_9PROT|nr:putative spermidine/putrescine transport system substrate-binding protein/spermidine/putrescine transport system substrate-binding protein [Insolitispirillum peregrinum]